MKRIFQTANEYVRQSDWKDLALVKYCLCAVGILIGILVSDIEEKMERLKAEGMDYDRKITINKQSIIRISGEKTIYFDPWDVPKKAQETDIIFITHEHSDHYSPEDIKGLLKDGGICNPGGTLGI